MKAISLFTGVGGFDLGFERAGIETVLQAERDPHCLKVLERHWPQVRRVTDVRCVRNAEFEPPQSEQQSGPTDLVFGGFPCQDLSVAGKRAGLGGERSGLWYEFHRVLSELRPRWTVIENVPGLLSSNDGRDFGILLDGLGELGYGVSWAVLDAQYFGVPQRRRRVFIVGCLGDRLSARQVLSVCESCGGNPETGRTAGERVAATIRGRSASPGVNMPGRGGEDDANLVAYTLSPSRGTGDGHGNAWNSNYIANHVTASAGHHGHSSPRGDGSDNLVTLANPLGSSQGGIRLDLDNDTYIPDIVSGVRRLTPLECERLQGFPDGWTDLPQSDSHRYRQMGNAVCVPVAEWIGHRIVAMSKVVAA